MTFAVKNKPVIRRDRQRFVFALGWAGRNGEQLLNEYGVFFWWKRFGTRERWWLHNIVNVLNAPVLVTLKRFAPDWVTLKWLYFTFFFFLNLHLFVQDVPFIIFNPNSVTVLQYSLFTCVYKIEKSSLRNCGVWM